MLLKVVQMQFQMVCIGRKWCDFISYDPRFTNQPSHLRMKDKRIQRDDEEINRINGSCCDIFNRNRTRHEADLD